MIIVYLELIATKPRRESGQGVMNMNEDFELAKLSLHNANDLIDIKENPVVDAVLLAPIKAIPIIGDLIDSSALT